LMDMFPTHGKPVLIIIGSEGFFEARESEDQEFTVDTREHRALARDFRDNPASIVQEAVLVTACQDDLVGGTEMVQVVAPFSYDDGLRIVWGERQEYHDDEAEYIGGEVSDVMRNAFSLDEEMWQQIAEAAARNEWPTKAMPHEWGGWMNCEDEEVGQALAGIENTGLDVTEQVKTIFREEGSESFADNVERADLVWDGRRSFGIGIKVLDPNIFEEPPDPPQMITRLVTMLREMDVLMGLDGIPVRSEIFEAVKTYEFREELDEIFGKEAGDEPGSG
jgi:hypothetical protein